MKKQVKKNIKFKSKSKIADVKYRKKPFIDKMLKYSYLIIILLCVIIYIQVLSFDFVYCDDSDIIIKEYDRIEHLGGIGTEFFKGYMDTHLHIRYYRKTQGRYPVT